MRNGKSDFIGRRLQLFQETCLFPAIRLKGVDAAVFDLSIIFILTAIKNDSRQYADGKAIVIAVFVVGIKFVATFRLLAARIMITPAEKDGNPAVSDLSRKRKQALIIADTAYLGDIAVQDQQVKIISEIRCAAFCEVGSAVHIGEMIYIDAVSLFERSEIKVRRSRLIKLGIIAFPRNQAAEPDSILLLFIKKPLRYLYFEKVLICRKNTAVVLVKNSAVDKHGRKPVFTCEKRDYVSVLNDKYRRFAKQKIFHIVPQGSLFYRYTCILTLIIAVVNIKRKNTGLKKSVFCCII